MEHETSLHVLAYVVIFGAAFLWLVDALVTCDVMWAIRIKWSLLWSAIRYVTSFSAVLLALNILTR